MYNFFLYWRIQTHQVKTDFKFEFTEEEQKKILNSFDEGLSLELIKKWEKMWKEIFVFMEN